MTDTDATNPLLGPDDPPPFTLYNPDGRAPVILVCDHASNAVPRALGDLGLPADAFGRHIAVDIGAADLTCRLADLLGGPAVLAGYSRLVIDCNRQPGDPTSIAETSDGIVVPGNCGLTDREAELRLGAVFWPYHQAVTNILAHQWRHGPPPALVAVHSFTPRMRDGQPRPWQVGILWNHDPRIAVPLIRLLREDPALCVGDNEPYSGRQVGFTTDNHAAAAGLPHVVLEVRQDLIEHPDGRAWWAERLGQALKAVLADASLHQVRHY